MSDVAFLIEVMIESYHQESGKKPAGIILGPPQYRELCYKIKSQASYLRDAHVDEVLLTEYKGFPVYVKELPGIDLMLSYQEAFSAAYR